MNETTVAKCIGCWCDDLHACLSEDGAACMWLRLNREIAKGVCSECPEYVIAWNADKTGDRTFPSCSFGTAKSAAIVRRGKERAA